MKQKALAKVTHYDMITYFLEETQTRNHPNSPPELGELTLFHSNTKRICMQSSILVEKSCNLKPLEISVRPTQNRGGPERVDIRLKSVVIS